ncbi:predicted protein, partial [Nematostella vectensis]
KADIVAITETWLSGNDDAIGSELCPDGYRVLDQVRCGRQGGGTALIFRDSLTVEKVDGGAKTSFEFSEWLIRLPSQELRVLILYRPQTDSNGQTIPIGTFFTELSDYLETIVLCKEQLVVVGDFNIHVDLLDGDAARFLELLECFSLQQNIAGLTHIHGHTLDLVITRQTEQIIRETPLVDRYLSDHASVLCSLQCLKPCLAVRTVSYRKLKSVDIQTLNSDL